MDSPKHTEKLIKQLFRLAELLLNTSQEHPQNEEHNPTGYTQPTEPTQQE